MSETINAMAKPILPECCPEGAFPFLPEDPNYTPKGTMISYDGVEAYTVGSGTKALIMIADLFGMKTGMHKLICDKFSERLPGYLIILPNFFQHGDLISNDDTTRGSVLNLILWPLCTCKLFGYL